MYAIIENGGRQYKVSSGDVIDVDLTKLPEDSDQIQFDRVLMIGDGDKSKIGTPLVEGAKVIASIQGQVKGKKIDVSRFTRRKGYHRSLGHRQQYLRVQIDQIVV